MMRCMSCKYAARDDLGTWPLIPKRPKTLRACVEAKMLPLQSRSIQIPALCHI